MKQLVAMPAYLPPRSPASICFYNAFATPRVLLYEHVDRYHTAEGCLSGTVATEQRAASTRFDLSLATNNARARIERGALGYVLH